MSTFKFHTDNNGDPIKVDIVLVPWCHASSSEDREKIAIAFTRMIKFRGGEPWFKIWYEVGQGLVLRTYLCVDKTVDDVRARAMDVIEGRA